MSATAARALFVKARTQIERPRDVLLIIRMLCWGVGLRMLKHNVTLPRLVRLVRWRTDHRHDPGGPDEREKIVTLARWACRPMPWSARGSCLERSLVTYRYLSATNLNPSLVIGMAPRSQEFDLMQGHAWVEIDGQPVGESAASLSEFHQVMMFDAAGDIVRAHQDLI